MSNWTRQNSRYNNNNNHYNNYHRLLPATTTARSSKPPLDNNCNLSVPAWEKDFCAKVGLIPWWKLLEAKRFMYPYDRVLLWDDSAGKEAFNKAKSRFWSEINGLPCELSLPDPDNYIDDVDWDAEVDTELIIDLESGSYRQVREQGEEHIVNLDSLLPSVMDSGTGWGDAEGINEETNKPKNSWDDHKCDGWIKEENTVSWNHNNNFGTDNSISYNYDNNFRNESWNHKNNNNNNNYNNNLRTESWNHKNSNNKYSLNHKKGREQGRESMEWRKRGEEARGGY
ncbi:unnamed protein product [Cochlearia groenlandica]